MAMQVTAAYPGREGKELILSTYLNLIFYGNGSYGIKAAAANYFGLTDLSELTLSQAAFLAALPQRPSALDPYQNAGGEPGSAAAAADAMRERDSVLLRMLEDEYITLDEYQAATAATWEEMKPSRVVHPLLEPHFTFRVQRELVRILAAMGDPGPRAGGADGRLPHHHHPRLPAPAGRAHPGPGVGRRPCRQERPQRRPGGDRLGDRGDRHLHRKHRLLQPDRPAGPGPVRRCRPGSPPARIGLQAHRLHLGLQGAHGDGVDDVRRCPDELRQP